MAKKKVNTKKLPAKIELISASKGTVREFELSHALRILALQNQIKLGDYELFNQELYQYDGKGITFREQPKAGEQLPEGSGE